MTNAIRIPLSRVFFDTFVRQALKRLPAHSYVTGFSFVTTAGDNNKGKILLELFGMPFKKAKN